MRDRLAPGGASSLRRWFACGGREDKNVCSLSRLSRVPKVARKNMLALLVALLEHQATSPRIALFATLCGLAHGENAADDDSARNSSSNSQLFFSNRLCDLFMLCLRRLFPQHEARNKSWPPFTTKMKLLPAASVSPMLTCL